MSANIADIMDDLGTQLETVAGLRVFAFPPKSAQPPFAFVNLPEVAYDGTFLRGQDRFTTEVWVGVPDVVDRAATALLGALVAGSGTGSVKEAIEGSTVFDHRVQSVTYSQIVLAAGSYSGAIFVVDTGA